MFLSIFDDVSFSMALPNGGHSLPRSLTVKLRLISSSDFLSVHLPSLRTHLGSSSVKLFVLVDMKISAALQKLPSDTVVLETTAEMPRSITHACEELLLLLRTFGVVRFLHDQIRHDRTKW